MLLLLYIQLQHIFFFAFFYLCIETLILISLTTLWENCGFLQVFRPFSGNLQHSHYVHNVAHAHALVLR